MNTNFQGSLGAKAFELYRIKSLDTNKIESKGIKSLVKHIQSKTK